MPQGVTLLALAQDPEHDQPVVSVQHSQKFDEEEEALLGEGEEPEEGAPEEGGESPEQSPEDGDES